MAESSAESPIKHDDEPMITQEKVAQPVQTDTASTSHDEKDASPSIACDVQDTTQQDDAVYQSKGGLNESAGEDAGQGTNAQVGVQQKRKKGKKKTPKSRRNITGFEGKSNCRMHVAEHSLTHCFQSTMPMPPLRPQKRWRRRRFTIRKCDCFW